MLGSKTIEAINSVDQDKLCDEFIDARREFYLNKVKSRPDQSVNIRGWLNRVDKFEIKENEKTDNDK